MGALKHSSITLHRGCLLLLFLLDGFHHYPNVVFLCVLTGGTVNMTVLSFMFPGPDYHKEKEEFCFHQELLRLICNGPPGLFDVGRVQPTSSQSSNDSFDICGRFLKANGSFLFCSNCHPRFMSSPVYYHTCQFFLALFETVCLVYFVIYNSLASFSYYPG